MKSDTSAILNQVENTPWCVELPVAFTGVKTWPLAQKERKRLKLSEKRNINTCDTRNKVSRK
jgi:hypothetical protein